jgi:hypothetical protein
MRVADRSPRQYKGCHWRRKTCKRLKLDNSPILTAKSQNVWAVMQYSIGQDPRPVPATWNRVYDESVMNQARAFECAVFAEHVASGCVRAHFAPIVAAKQSFPS